MADIDAAAAPQGVPPFHLAFLVRDLEEARGFYREVLGCGEGRSTSSWIDFDFYGHQIVAHLDPQAASRDAVATGAVDGHNVPVPHFGVVLGIAAWEALVERLRRHGVHFEMEPTTRFKGLPGEQSTTFFKDPSGNAIEIKAFRTLESLFAR
ncbi:VOC family protein [Sphingomonas sp. dw_22]|uniref:VOC family protein n=1 Tax=Sphingomonas sp. dw_22 TaxID=2721175 RepID=UPI001BD3D26F|nr:VOC family protein [Sphingomonas sp. dw_22]